MKKEVQWDSPKISNFIQIIAIFAASVLSIISLCMDCSQRSKIDELDYRTKALTFQPKLKVISKPFIEGIKVRLDRTRQPEFDQNTVTVSFNLTIKSKLRLVNVGSALARILALVGTDTLSGSPSIRKIILKEESRKDRVETAFWSGYFDLPEVLPEDTTELKFEHNVQFVSDGEFTLHYLILYENQVGVYYDTYYWVRYKNDPLVAELESPRYQLIDGRMYARQKCKLSKTGLLNSIRFEESDQKYRIYSAEETKSLNDFLKNRAKSLKQKMQ